MRHLTLLVLGLAALPLLATPSRAAKIDCPDGPWVLSGADLIAENASVPPTLDIVEGTVTVRDGCPVRKGRAKPTKKGLRVTGKFRDCGDAAKLKLKALTDAACTNLTGTIRGRGVTPVSITGVPSLCGNGTVDTSLGEECDTGVPCPTLTSVCTQTCRCSGGGTGGTTTTTVPPGGGSVSVSVVDAFCTADACFCGPVPGSDYHLQATGTVSGPVGTELRVNVNKPQGGLLNCGDWSEIDESVNPSCDTISCCRRETGQPETANWAATEAIDTPCICPVAPSGFLHNYLGQAQLPPAGAPVESEKTTSPCP
jgi:hypothetical protein